MQNSSHFIMGQVISEKVTEKGLSENTISSYKNLALVHQDLTAENLAIYFTAKENLDNNKLNEALELAKVMISKMPDDSETRNLFDYLVEQIQERLKKLGLQNSSDPQIGIVYRAFVDIGHCELETHYIAAQHYIVAGELILAKELIQKLKETVPNYIGLKELEEQLLKLSKEAK